MTFNKLPDISEKLATISSLEQLTSFIWFAKIVKWENLWNFDKEVLVAMESVKLLTEWLIYAFRVEDDYSERQWWNSDWVYLFKRVWLKSSINIFSWQDISWWIINIPTDLDAVEFLVKSWIKKVITWPIRWEFLWIESVSIDNDDWAAQRIWILTEKSISTFRENGIDVTSLNSLL